MEKLIRRMALVVLLFVVTNWGTSASFDGVPWCPPVKPPSPYCLR
jgi:hypothetical protein